MAAAPTTNHTKQHEQTAASQSLQERFARVQLLLLDVDGVLTDGSVTWVSEGVEQKTFHTRDGLGAGWRQCWNRDRSIEPRGAMPCRRTWDRNGTAGRR